VRGSSGGQTDRHIWRRRVIALAAAYAVALSSLLASFGAARAAAAPTPEPLGVICHHDIADQDSPLTGGPNSKICIDSCCIGCLMPMAALPPPPATIAPSSLVISYRVAPLAMAALSGGRVAKSHRSRAPPSSA